MSLTLGAAWRAERDRFRAAGIEGAEREARLLAEAVLAIDAAALSLRETDAISEAQAARLTAAADRRLSGEPVARIAGAADFYGRRFILNAATLVPRPETELLVEQGLAALSGKTRPRVLDLGTGTGCIAISLLAELPAASGVAVDASAEALEAVETNAVRYGVSARLILRHGDWYAPLAPGDRFDLIVSNPPYIETAVIPTLMPEVREHDPYLALDGGDDGLNAYRAIIAGAAAHLAPGGSLILEIGSTQAGAVVALCEAQGFVKPRVERDLAGLDRAIIAPHL